MQTNHIKKEIIIEKSHQETNKNHKNIFLNFNYASQVCSLHP